MTAFGGSYEQSVPSPGYGKPTGIVLSALFTLFLIGPVQLAAGAPMKTICLLRRLRAAAVAALFVAMPVTQLVAECPDTATSVGGKLTGERFMGFCVTIDIKIIKCTSCECHYLGVHEDTGMVMSFVTTGTDDGCGISWPISVTIH